MPACIRARHGPAPVAVQGGKVACATARHGLALVAGLLAACALPAAAATLQVDAAVPAVASQSRPWSNALDTLKAHGLSFGGFLQLDASHVLAGGMPNALWLDKQYLLDLNLTLDTRAAFGWPGGTLFVDFQGHGGSSVVVRQVPVLADADNMDAATTYSIDRAWYQQDFFGRRWHAQAGLMYVDDQFLTVPYGQNFVSLDFSSDASISTFVLPTYPKGAWGVDAWGQPDAHLSLAIGAFRNHATELAYDPGGNLLIAEAGWQAVFRGLPCKVQVGAWTDDGTFRRFEGGVAHRASGAYLVASDQLWAPAGSTDRGLGAFLQLGAGPPSVAAVRRHFGLGFVWTGPLARRPHDEFGIALSNSYLTPEARFAHGSEREIEAYYQFAVPGGWTVQPDLEHWRHAGGGTTPDTWLALVRVVRPF